MVRKNISILKKGYIRAKDIFKKAIRNVQVKIGGKAYNEYVEDESIRKGLGLKGFRRVRALRVLPNFYKNQDLNSVRALVRNYYNFNKDEKEMLFVILQNEMRKNGGKRVINFKFRGSENFNDRQLTLRDENLRDFVDIIARGGEVIQDATYGSDAVASLAINEIEDFVIKDVKPTGNLFKTKTGKFFKHDNNTDIDLTRYQIYSLKRRSNGLEEVEGQGFIQRHCVLYALDKSGIKPDLVSRIATTFDNGMHFAKKNFHKVSEIIKHKIILKTYDGKRTQKYTFGKGNKSIELALYQEHYFINELTDYSSYSSLNYQKINHLKDFNKIIGFSNGKYKYSNTLYKVDSFTLIKNLFDTGNFKENVYLSKYDGDREMVKQIKLNEDHLENTKIEQKEYKPKNKKELENNKTAIFYADVETDTTEAHIPLMIGVLGEKNNQDVDRVKIFVNEDNSKKFFEKFMKYVNDCSKDCGNVIIYFHNLKYDYHVLLPYIFRHKEAPCEKDGQLYSVKIQYGKRFFELRDSYKLASFPLSKFQSTFALDEKYNKKEAIAYNYYKLSNMNVYELPVKEYEKYLTDKEISIFHDNLKENSLFFEYHQKSTDKQYYFNPLAYYRHYLKYDVYVLYKGLEKFQENIDKITDGKMKLFDYLTISSLTNAYMQLNGCFDNVYGVVGNLRQFISNAVTGGRVQVNEKYLKKIINGKIADYDGVSLYPSAISRLCKERGLPTGMAKPIDVYTKEELDKYSYYIVKVKITKINKYQQLPMVCYKDDNGILQYTNKVDKPIISYIDMITLEDWINFQKIEYEILDGVYWNNGYNKKMGDCIDTIFNDRLKYKKEGNEAMQQVLKLMMNSSYGKTIMKKSTTRFNIISEDYHDRYLETWFSNIIYTEKLPNGEYKVKECSYDDSVNYGHVGVFILSYSKRIMNEVFDVANDLDCPLYYTDTDSIHCNYNDVSKIEEGFQQRYGRILTGKQLGQFHIDFDLKGAKSEIYATKSLFLGKKSYIDILESTDAKGNKINGCHFRMKGIPEKSLQHCSNLNFNNDLFKLYEHLSTGKELDVVLNPEGVKVMFEYADNRVSTRVNGSFTRTIKF